MDTDKTRLHCFGGAPTPAELEGDLRSWLLLPARVRHNYWELLGLNLAPKVDDRITARVRELMSQYELDGEQLAPSIRACRGMLRQGARHGITVDQLVEDIGKVIDDEQELVDCLANCYRKALPMLNREIVLSTLAEHGNLATHIDWRIDKVTRSNHGVDVDASVAVFSFRYREGETERRFSVQLLPDHVNALRLACEEILTSG